VGDLEKVPENFEPKDCYEKIYDWYKKSGKKILKDIQEPRKYERTSLKLIKKLPTPGIVTEPDMDFIFREVISGLFEWGYHKKDNAGIKMAAYAHHALKKSTVKDFMMKSSNRVLKNPNSIKVRSLVLINMLKLEKRFHYQKSHDPRLKLISPQKLVQDAARKSKIYTAPNQRLPHMGCPCQREFGSAQNAERNYTDSNAQPSNHS
jgi:hypothetical protein